MAGKHWVTELLRDNLLALADVTIDIQREEQLVGEFVEVPLFQDVIKFRELLPADSSSLRDRYCEGRWKAVQLLAKHGAVTDLKVREANHRWDNVISLKVLPPFRIVAETVESELKRRGETVDDDRSSGAADRESALVPSLPQTVSLRWLATHVPMHFWFWLFGTYVAVFVAGVKVADLSAVRQLVGTETKALGSSAGSSTAVAATSDTQHTLQPLPSIAVTTIPSVTAAHFEQVLTDIRAQHRLRPLVPSETGRPIAAAPEGTFCYASTLTLEIKGPSKEDSAYRGPCDKQPLTRSFAFEILNFQGENFVAAVLPPTEAASITRLDGRTIKQVLASPMPWSDASTLALIPLSRVTNARWRQMQMDDGSDLHTLDISLR